jgi:polyisoprenoid-binding protein YceI
VMCEEVLETDRFPEISYECSKISANGSGDRYWLASNGELTLPGVTKPLPVSARAVIAGNTVRATGEFSVRQSEFGIAL